MSTLVGSGIVFLVMAAFRAEEHRLCRDQGVGRGISEPGLLVEVARRLIDPQDEWDYTDIVSFIEHVIFRRLEKYRAQDRRGPET